MKLHYDKNEVLHLRLETNQKSSCRKISGSLAEVHEKKA
jgi:hypothetical protein